jgi:formylglycine-generating enzyme required for sulfatase activity
MALVDAGIFPSGPNNLATQLPAFYMDVYPTTNRDYAAFIRATGQVPATARSAGKPVPVS